MKVNAHFGPAPRDLRVAIGEDGYDITNALYGITIKQGYGDRNYLPVVELELSIVTTDTEVDGELELFMLPPVRAALIRLGWLPPEHVEPLTDRVNDIVQAAYAYVDMPQDLVWNPEVEDEHPGKVAYEHLAGTVERHRAYAREIQEP